LASEAICLASRYVAIGISPNFFRKLFQLSRNIAPETRDCGGPPIKVPPVRPSCQQGLSSPKVHVMLSSPSPTSKLPPWDAARGLWLPFFSCLRRRDRVVSRRRPPTKIRGGSLVGDHCRASVQRFTLSFRPIVIVSNLIGVLIKLDNKVPCSPVTCQRATLLLQLRLSPSQPRTSSGLQ